MRKMFDRSPSLHFFFWSEQESEKSSKVDQEDGRTYLKKCKVLPGLEPGLQGSEPWVLTNYTIEPDLTSSSIQKKNARKVESNHWDVGPPWIWNPSPKPSEFIRAKVPGVRIELTTFGLWDQRSTNWANPACHGCFTSDWRFERQSLTCCSTKKKKSHTRRDSNRPLGFTNLDKKK